MSLLRPAIYLLCTCLLFTLLSWLVPSIMWHLALIPREITHLPGIAFAPLLHVNVFHLGVNLLNLFALSTVTLAFYSRPVFYRATLIIWLLSGLLVWCLARHYVHVGASGIIYGYISFLLYAGWRRRNVQSLFIAVLVAIVYAGSWWGLFPGQQGVSWEYHVAGAVAGVIAAAWLIRR